MNTSTMTAKGQITVPKELRDALGWRPGNTMAFECETDGVKVVKGRRRRRGSDLVEKLRKAPWDPALTTDALIKLTRS